MNIGVTDSAIQNLYLYVVRANITTGETEGNQSLRWARRRVSFGIVHLEEMLALNV